MIIAFLIGIIVLFIRSTDEGKPLFYFKMQWYRICPNWLKKATVECLECRILWMSLIGTIGVTLLYGNLFWLIGFPLTWLLSLYLYQNTFE